MTWRDINPERGVFVWARLDDLVDNGRCLLVLGSTPQWAAHKPDLAAAAWIGPGSSSRPENLDDWDAYVTAVVTRYKGRITAYQIWNEPQDKKFWESTATFPVLAEMTKRAYKIIKVIDPTARVVAPPVLPRPASGGMTRGILLLRALKNEGWPVDVFSLHAYPEHGMGAPRFDWMVQRVKEVLLSIGAPHCPLWVTELNYNLMEGALPKRVIKPYMVATDRYARIQGVQRIYWYCWGHSDPKVLGIPFFPDSKGTAVLANLQAVSA